MSNAIPSCAEAPASAVADAGEGGGGSQLRTAPPIRCKGWGYQVWKWSFDRPIALLLIGLFSPVLVVLYVWVRVSSPGPAVFRQMRLGRGGLLFPCLKFRSMRVDAEEILRKDPALYAEYVENDFKLPAERDPRITPVGRFLRKTSLDELPQLFNVLRGEMSLVGPRPLVPDEIVVYGDAQADFLSAIPGITGEWQVSGRSQLPYPERCEVELRYVYRWSPLRDLQILLRTVGVVAKREGAF